MPYFARRWTDPGQATSTSMVFKNCTECFLVPLASVVYDVGVYWKSTPSGVLQITEGRFDMYLKDG